MAKNKMAREVKKIVIVDDRKEGFVSERAAFKAKGIELNICSCNNKNELLEATKDAYIIAFTFSKFPEEVINKLMNCKMLIRYGVGLENVDIEAASKKGIYVCNTPNYGAFAVAEHAFALLISLTRKLTLLDDHVRNSEWGIEDVMPVYSLKDKVMGIVGFGSIGRYLCKMAGAFCMKIIVYDPYVNDNEIEEVGAKAVGFEELIKKADHISIHAPLTESTRHLFNKTIFKKMKKTATIVNTSRGGLISQSDLAKALKSGTIAAAGLDVFEDEPLDRGDQLLTMHNVILTPHVAWYTEESIVNLHRELIEDVMRVLHGNKPLNAVN